MQPLHEQIFDFATYNKYLSSFIKVPFFMHVTEIVEITPNITKVLLLLFKWTRFMRDL